MQLDLTPEIEQVLQAEASANGVSPEAITLRILASYTQIRSQQSGGALLQSYVPIEDRGPVDRRIPAESSEQRQAAAARILGRRKSSEARIGPPDGMDWREWIHEGHRY